jgi:hypothetical protein
MDPTLCGSQQPSALDAWHLAVAESVCRPPSELGAVVHALGEAPVDTVSGPDFGSLFVSLSR